MSWNPELYNQFKTERFAPFYDLLSLVKVKSNLKVADLGCGTGELTRKLAGHLAGSQILGIDSSPEMLEKSDAFPHPDIRFVCRTIQEQLTGGETWDLIFSNAALQWLEDHTQLFPSLISLLNQGGQLTVQVPSNHDHPAYRYIYELARQTPYQEALQGWERRSPVMGISEYSQLFFDNGCSDIIVFEKVYPHILKDWEEIFGWVSGTALIPYMERLPDLLAEKFKSDYRRWLSENYAGSPVFFPFRRILMSATV